LSEPRAKTRRHVTGGKFRHTGFGRQSLITSSPSSFYPPPAKSAPRVRVSQTEGGHAVEPALDETVDLDAFRTRFVDAFGTTERVIADALFQQVVNALHPDPKKPLDAATANLALALLHRIGPRDEIEAMLGCQMVVAHVSAMDASRRALHVEQTAGGRQAYLSLAHKLMTLYTAQMDALNRYRGKGTTQKIVIERVLVAPGAQAIVGAVANGGRGDGG
jgi:hypothetical protein